MKMMLGGFKVESDERQFIVYEKKVVQASRFTKPENVGKDKWEEIGYLSSLEGLVRFLCKKIVLQTDDLQDALDKIEELHKEIKAIAKKLGMERLEG